MEATTPTSFTDTSVDAAELQAYMAFARQLADVSAAIIRRYYRQDYQVDLKDDLSPVTIADRGAEEAMRELIMREFPDHGVLGEEFGHYQPDARDQWVLDPIDGTKNFVAGSYLFGT
ncbi:MAG: inositol monophosphatase family protein, partial [Caldilineaceae bacterium]